MIFCQHLDCEADLQSLLEYVKNIQRDQKPRKYSKSATVENIDMKHRQQWQRLNVSNL
ncbi:hypothetical protein DOY81_008643, partial [Sarcophaga bullata]